MELLEAEHRLQRELLEGLAQDQGLEVFLHELARTLADHLSTHHQVLVGLTQQRPRRNTVIASSSTTAARMEEVQASFDEGPCLDAERTDTTIWVRDTTTETRWPQYMAEVRRSGLHSILAIPLTVDGSAPAALNLYAEPAGVFQDTERAIAQRYAALARQGLAVALRMAAHSDNAAHRAAAMESRTTIDLAVGMIMGQNRCSQQEAFQILQRASSHRNIKLRALAESMIDAIGQDAAQTVFTA